MTEFKGTKGKWEIECGSYSVYTDKEHKKDITDGVVCRMHLGVKNYENAEANAKLIACAPEMLEMLAKINLFINVNKDKNYVIELLSREASNLESLIKKATE